MDLRYFIIELPNGKRYKIVISNEDSSPKTNFSPLGSKNQLETNDPKDTKDPKDRSDQSVSTLVKFITNSPQNTLSSKINVPSSSGKSSELSTTKPLSPEKIAPSSSSKPSGKSSTISKQTSIGGTRVSKKRRKYKKTIKKKHKKITKKQKKRKQNNSIK